MPDAAATVVPDWLLDVRNWLRAHPNLAAVGGRVFFRLPDDATPFPMLRVYASAGLGWQPGSEAPLFDAHFAVEVWGKGSKMAQQVRQLAQAVQGALFMLEPGLLVAGGTTYTGGGYSTADVDAPAADTGDPRHVVDCALTVRTAGPAGT